jgi:hypothetical protein
MELLEGMPLVERLGYALDVPSARRVGAAIIDAIAAYHRLGLSHADLYDANVFVDALQVKVIDPLYFDSSLLQSTAPRQAQQARDLRNVRDLLTQILYCVPGALDLAARFERASMKQTLEVMRSAFEDALGAVESRVDDGVVPTGGASKSTRSDTALPRLEIDVGDIKSAFVGSIDGRRRALVAQAIEAASMAWRALLDILGDQFEGSIGGARGPRADWCEQTLALSVQPKHVHENRFQAIVVAEATTEELVLRIEAPGAEVRELLRVPHDTADLVAGVRTAVGHALAGGLREKAKDSGRESGRSGEKASS